MGYSVDSSNVKVTLTRESDSKVWTFSDSSSNGEFYVNNGGYGKTGCIIFRPDDISTYSANDIFTVEIEGLNEPVSYTVNFFDLEKEQETTTTTTTEPQLEVTMWGDANCDNIVNISDVVSTTAFISNSTKNVLSKQGELNADVHENGNGLNANDAYTIQQRATEVITELPVSYQQ